MHREMCSLVSDGTGSELGVVDDLIVVPDGYFFADGLGHAGLMHAGNDAEIGIVSKPVKIISVYQAVALYHYGFGGPCPAQQLDPTLEIRMQQRFAADDRDDGCCDPGAPGHYGLFTRLPLIVPAEIIVVVSITIAAGKIAFVDYVDFKGL